jgi:hypothetical protein
MSKNSHRRHQKLIRRITRRAKRCLKRQGLPQPPTVNYYFAVDQDNQLAKLTPAEFEQIITFKIDFNWEQHYLVSPITGERILYPNSEVELIENYF